MPERIEWPSYSPDISPIENVWGWLKDKVARDCPSTKTALRDRSGFFYPYIHDMPDRMKQLVASKGGKISH